MNLQFLKTRIGIALIVAVIAIISAAFLKSGFSKPSSNIADRVGLIADSSIKEMIANGAASNLDQLGGTSTSSNDIASLPQLQSSTTAEKTTPTDRFSRDFFTKYIQIKQSGTAVDENTGMNLVNQLLTQDYGTQVSEKTYTESNITISNDVSLQSIKRYGNTLGAIIQQPLPKGYEQELRIIAKVNDTGDDSGLAKLSMNIAHYKALRDGILSISVPLPLKNAHLSLVNALSGILEGVEGMSLIQSDPVGATKMISRYQDSLASLSLPMDIIKNYLEKESISFSSSESGYILTQ